MAKTKKQAAEPEDYCDYDDYSGKKSAPGAGSVKPKSKSKIMKDIEKTLNKLFRGLDGLVSATSGIQFKVDELAALVRELEKDS